MCEAIARERNSVVHLEIVTVVDILARNAQPYARTAKIPLDSQSK
jgi:hypothetical protein